jgi:hypothetical protein
VGALRRGARSPKCRTWKEMQETRPFHLRRKAKSESLSRVGRIGVTRVYVEGRGLPPVTPTLLARTKRETDLRRPLATSNKIYSPCIQRRALESLFRTRLRRQIDWPLLIGLSVTIKTSVATKPTTKHF